MADAHVYLRPFEWYGGSGSIPLEHWRAPGGLAVGCLDLRTTEQRGTPGGEGGPGLFAYEVPRDAPDGIYLGQGLDGTLTVQQRGELRAMLGLGELPSASPRELVKHLFTQYVDPTGVTSRKPVRPATGKDVRLTFAGQDVFREPFEGPHRENYIAVFQADYRRARALLAQLPPDKAGEYFIALQKWTGAATLAVHRRLNSTTARSMLPPEYKGDGARRPTSTVTEGWPTTDTTVIATGQDQPWAEVSGDHSTNEEEIGGGAGGTHYTIMQNTTTGAYISARCETALSSDDHSHEALQSFMQTPDDNKLGAVCTRFDGGADTMYWFAHFKTTGGPERAFFGYRVTGTNTFAVSAVAPDPLLSDVANNNQVLQKGKSDGSLHTWSLAGTAYITDTSDTGITGNLKFGILRYSDNFQVVGTRAHVATDLAVATFAYLIEAKDLTPGDLIAQGWTERQSADGIWDVTDYNVMGDVAGGGVERVIRQDTTAGPSTANYGVSKDEHGSFTTEIVQGTTSVSSALLIGYKAIAFNPASGDGYGVVIADDVLRIYDLATFTILDEYDLGVSVAVREWWRVRAEYEPATHTIRGKAWRDAYTEPVGWQLEYADGSALFTPAYVCLSCRFRSQRYWYRWFGVGIGEDAPVQEPDTYIPETVVSRGGWTDTLEVATDAAVIAGLATAAAPDAASPWQPVGDGSDTLKVRLEQIASYHRSGTVRFGLQKQQVGVADVVSIFSTIELRSPDGGTVLATWTYEAFSSLATRQELIPGVGLSGQHQVWFVPSHT